MRQRLLKTIKWQKVKVAVHPPVVETVAKVLNHHPAMSLAVDLLPHQKANQVEAMLKKKARAVDHRDEKLER